MGIIACTCPICGAVHSEGRPRIPGDGSFTSAGKLVEAVTPGWALIQRCSRCREVVTVEPHVCAAIEGEK